MSYFNVYLVAYGVLALGHLVVQVVYGHLGQQFFIGAPASVERSLRNIAADASAQQATIAV